MQRAGDETKARRAEPERRNAHPEQWWAQFLVVSERFDEAIAVEGFGELIAPLIANPLLRREVELATTTVMRHLERPVEPELADLAAAVTERLDSTIQRINARSMSSSTTEEAEIMAAVLHGRYAASASAAEVTVGSPPLQKVFVRALRLERFDGPLALRLLELGQSPAQAIRSGSLVGQYLWWPSWLLKIMTERAVAGTLDESMVTALDNCAFASLTPVQSHLARKLLAGDHRMIGVAAERLETLGENEAADRLRHGDLDTVALAVRLMTL